jgi:hypothetical protein
MHSTRLREVLALALAAALPLFAGGPPENDSRREEDRVLAQTGLVDPALVVAWNQTMNDIGFADPTAFLKPIRAHAMMHIAMHDALNAVVPLYRQYAYRSHDPGAHAIAAAAQAAYQVGISQYPDQQGKLDAELARWLSKIPDTPHKARGIAVGRQSAAAILALRVNDGWDYQGTYTFSNEPGAYQTTPPWNGFILQPGFRYAKPFGLRSPDQFRPGPPPRLESAQYAAAFNEVKDFGRVNSVVRTQEQTLYAVWWLEFAETSVNRLARQLATQRRTHLWQAARMFALLNMSLYDGYIAVFDSKYEYNHWRPYTAIRQAALDGNAATAADPTWESLRPAPPFPEYVSGHAAATAASMDILSRTFGNNVSFTMATTTAPPAMPTRSFPSFSAAAAECADSRVRIGFHFRYATDSGLTLGRAVGGWLDENYLMFRRGSSQ